MQAIALIRDASQHDDVALAVSWSGDVREANALEKVIYGIVDFFDTGAPERRMNEAREAVISKLTNELRILSGPASGGSSAVLTAEMSGMVNQVAKALIDAGTISKKGLPGDLRNAIQNIKDITAEPDKKSRKLIWKAVAEQRNDSASRWFGVGQIPGQGCTFDPNLFHGCKARDSLGGGGAKRSCRN